MTQELITGRLRVHFVGSVLILGLAVLIVLTIIAPNPPGGFWLALAAVLLLAGNWLSKYAVLKVGRYALYY